MCSHRRSPTRRSSESFAALAAALAKAQAELVNPEKSLLQWRKWSASAFAWFASLFSNVEAFGSQEGGRISKPTLLPSAQAGLCPATIKVRIAATPPTRIAGNGRASAFGKATPSGLLGARYQRASARARPVA
jgi:hypothetical protein